MSRTKVITPPEPAVTLAEAKAHLRVDHTDDDAMISAYIAAAQGHLDGPNGVLGVCFGAQTLEAALDAFPCDAIRLPFGPAVSVVSVGYIDADGAAQTVPPGDYVLDSYSADPWIVPYAAWPSTMSTVNAVKVRWIAGEGWPTPLCQAILLLVGHAYANREAVAAKLDEMPLGVYALASPFRTVFI